MKLEKSLASVPPAEWVANQVIVFDWYDGPRQGVACLGRPMCEFAFTLLAERPCPDGLDDRLFRVSELPANSVARILGLLRPQGSPSHKVWVPVWQPGRAEERSQVDQEIDSILSQQRDTGLVIATRDMETFLGCWHAERNGSQITDWFSALSIP